MKKAQPTTHERVFASSEMFFSTTDSKGLITAGNSVFQRISGHPFETLMGAPHNIIRHPDMPKIVFKALWDTIGSGKPICAYVKNMAANGDYYWVLATVFPIEDGYLSVRIKPTSGLFDAAQKIYPLVLAEERKNGVDSSAKLLFKILGEAGFATYEAFMTQSLISEITGRENFITENSQADMEKNSSHRNLELRKMFGKLEGFASLNRTLTESTLKIGDSYGNLRFICNNMSVASKRLGDMGSTLAAVSDAFNSFGAEIQQEVLSFNGLLKASQEVLQKSEFRIAASFLQEQMIEFFMTEFKNEGANSDQGTYDQNLKLLTHSGAVLTKESITALHEAQEVLQAFLSSVNTTEKAASALEIVRQTGKISAAGIPTATASFSTYFNELDQINQTIQTALKIITQGIEPLKRDIKTMREQSHRLDFGL